MAFPMVWKRAKKPDQAQINQPLAQPGRTTITEYWAVLFAEPVVTDTPTAIETDQLVVLGATDADSGLELPRTGHTYLVGGVRRTCTGVLPSRSSGNPHLWDVQVNFEVQPFDFVGTDNIRNITLSRGHQIVEQVVYFDRINKPFWNTVRDDLRRLPNKKFAYEEISINYTCDGISNLSTIDGCVCKVNSDPVTFTIGGLTRSYGPRQMMLLTAPINAVRTVKDGITSYTQTVTLNFQCLHGSDTFKWRAPNEGTNFWNYTTGKREAYQPSGPASAVGKYVFLDALGAPIEDRTTPPVMLPDGAAGVDPDFAPTGRFEIEDQTTFSSLFTNLEDP